jgi:DNA-binding transcriptional LysR family regulator
MNVHQLELFYHVVVHQGVSRAAVALDKEQPTLSQQINDLEAHLRGRLYHRRPFRLTEKGEILFKAIEPFFRELPRLEAQLLGGDLLRIGASRIILADHFPIMEKEVRKEFPNLRLTLLESNQPQLARFLERGEIDMAITLLPAEVPQKVFARPLVDLPLILLVPETSGLRSAAALLERGQIHESLICLTQDEMICREFQETLKRMGIEWRPQMEVSSLDLVSHYVQEGYGIGLSVSVPGTKFAPELRAIALPGFPVLRLGMLWRDDENKPLRAFRDQIQERAKMFLEMPQGLTN